MTRQAVPMPAARACTVLFALFFALFCAVFSANPAFSAVKIQEVTSSRGIKAWLVEDYSVPVISIRFSFHGGTTQDPPGKEGAVNLMTGLFDEGAGALDSNAFQERLDNAGAEMSFGESPDDVYGSMRMIEDTRDEAFELLRLAISEPRFDAEPFERIRGQIVTGIRARASEPETVAAEKWNAALFATHPYARNERGTEKTLAAVTPADIKALHARLFARDNLVIGVVGAIDAATLKAKLDLVFGALPQKTDLAPVADIKPKLGQTVTVEYDLPQTNIQMAFPGVNRADPDFFAAHLMNHILGGGTFTSRLYNEVREKRGLAYGADSYIVTMDHTNRLTIGTSTRADRAKETLDLIKAVVAEMAADGPTEAELADAKKFVIGSYAISNLDTSMSIASTLTGLQRENLGIDYIERRAALVQAVTLDEVKAVAKKLLKAEPAVLLMGPAIEPAKAEGSGG
jgi:zinc protease